jgi:hypothetical protein
MHVACTHSPCPQIPMRVASTPTVSCSASTACRDRRRTLFHRGDVFVGRRNPPGRLRFSWHADHEEAMAQWVEVTFAPNPPGWSSSSRFSRAISCARACNSRITDSRTARCGRKRIGGSRARGGGAGAAGKILRKRQMRLGPVSPCECHPNSFRDKFFCCFRVCSSNGL